MKTWRIVILISSVSLLSLAVGCQKLADEFVGKKPDEAKTINITMIAKSSTNPVFLSARVGAEAAAKYPGIKIVGEFYHAETAEDAAAEVLRVNNAYPGLKGWAMVGGWPFFSETLLDKIDPGKIKIVAVDALPVQLPYLEKGIVQVLLGQPTFKWGKVSVESILDKIHLNKDVPIINQMKLIRVSKANLGGWSRQLRAWGYEGIPKNS